MYQVVWAGAAAESRRASSRSAIAASRPSAPKHTSTTTSRMRYISDKRVASMAPDIAIAGPFVDAATFTMADNLGEPVCPSVDSRELMSRTPSHRVDSPRDS